jgi:hypothetical protein
MRKHLAAAVIGLAACGDNLPPPEPVILFQGNVWGGNLAVADGRVYFTAFTYGAEEDQAVLSVPAGGGAVTRLWHGAPHMIFGNGMAVAGGDVFWSQEADPTNAVYRAPVGGGERGYVLLVDGDGQLEKRTMQVAKSGKPDAHDAFSRSIAEAVLIDGEAIVTVDAALDGRLSEYVSVHKLMLRSVACLPIRGPSGTVGVLYLEHRRSRGRFSDSAVDLLHAFADQAAIALENARLLLEDKRRQAELQAANAELEAAKRGLEELLHARTEELAEAQRELKRTRRSRRDAYIRHGMVGQSAKMRRVSEAIDRLQAVRVPVVIYGESGTG